MRIGTRLRKIRTPVTAAALATLTCVTALPVGVAMGGATSTTVSGAQSPSSYGEPVAFTATVDGEGPTGTVTFKDGSTTLGSGVLKPLAVSSIAAGHRHTCTVTAGGAARCWGANDENQLGVGPAGDQSTPVPVSGLSSGVAAVATGDTHSCALTDAGAVLCWGSNGFGQLGDNTTTDRNTPVVVSGMTSGVTAIAAGGYHTCAIQSSGAVRCWGRNLYGALGDGTTTDRHAPVAVSGLSSGARAIAAGLFHTCAATETGAAECWGNNERGQIGDGTTTDRHGPVSVSGLSSGVTDIFASRGHSCAVTEAGAARCWGYNNEGQLGDGSTTDRHTPVTVSGLARGVSAIGGGDYHTCALIGAGAARCWGSNAGGSLGDGTTTDRLTPVAVSGLASGGLDIVGGGSSFSCALMDTGAARCWGYNGYGQIGDGTFVSRSTPVDVDGFGAGALLVRGATTVLASGLAAGAHAITARYGGDGDNDASTSAALTHVVEKGGTEITKIKVKPKKPKAGKSARIKIVIAAVAPASGTPAGKVVVKDGKKKLGKFKLTKGKAKLKLRGLEAGTHKLKAKYKGTGNWVKSTGKANLKVGN
jgi:alpha-tubulin suppressor-like RCC1 family protein